MTSDRWVEARRTCSQEHISRWRSFSTGSKGHTVKSARLDRDGTWRQILSTVSHRVLTCLLTPTATSTALTRFVCVLGLELARHGDLFQEKGGHKGIPTMVREYFARREESSIVGSDGKRVPKPVPLTLGPGDACIGNYHSSRDCVRLLAASYQLSVLWV